MLRALYLQRSISLTTALLFFGMTLLSSCGGGGGGGGAGTLTQAIENFNAAGGNIALVAGGTDGLGQIMKDYVNADLDAVSPEAFMVLSEKLVNSAGDLVEAVEGYNYALEDLSRFAAHSQYKPAGKIIFRSEPDGAVWERVIDVIPDANSGISPSFVKGVFEEVGESHEEAKIYWEMYKQGLIDQEELKKQLTRIRNEAKSALSEKYQIASLSTLSGLMGGCLASSMQWGALAVFGAGALASFATGLTLTVIYGWWSDTPGMRRGKLVITESRVGEAIPNIYGGDSSLGKMVIMIPGFAPLLIEGYEAPKDGEELVIDYVPIEEEDVNPDDQIVVEFRTGKAYSDDCNDIVWIGMGHTPANPVSGDTVGVAAFIVPIVEGCKINFTTFFNFETPKHRELYTNAEGKAGFDMSAGLTGDRVTVKATPEQGYYGLKDYLEAETGWRTTLP